MERETGIAVRRLDDDIIEINTLIKEKYTNQEFYDFWAKLKMRESGIKQQIMQASMNIDEMKKHLDLTTQQIIDYEKHAKECEARI